MPLYADGVFIGRSPYRLDDAVLRMRRSLRLFCQAADGLVVHGIYHHRIAAVVGKEPGGRYFHIVYIAFHDVGAAVKAPAPVDVGQILYERTAEDDVQKLTAAADPQQRPVFFKRLAAEADFKVVAVEVGRDRPLVLFAVEGGGDVAAAREDEAVEL